MPEHRSYHGVTPATRSPAKPWKAQICFGGRPHFIGNFAEDTEAARERDNAAFYLHASKRITKLKLNFPEDYQGDNFPPPSEATHKLLDKADGLLGARPTESLPTNRESMVKAIETNSQTVRTLMQMVNRLSEFLLFQNSELQRALQDLDTAPDRLEEIPQQWSASRTDLICGTQVPETGTPVLAPKNPVVESPETRQE